MKFKRRLKKERIKRTLEGHVGKLEMAALDARRFNEIAARVAEIGKAGIIDAETTRELAQLSQEIESIRAQYKGAK